jgi:predicted ATPase with chaperone activity
MTAVASNSHSLLDSLLSEDAFYPAEPRTLAEVGVSPVLIESLACKLLLQLGTCSGREAAKKLCLPFPLLDEILSQLRVRQLVVHTGQAQLSDYIYRLTELGVDRARAASEACSYVGPVPVPLDDYILSVEAQSIRSEAVRRDDLIDGFRGISAEPAMLDILGPAINSGAGLFLYGPPGNGKTTLAKRITRCFGQHVWIPQALIEDGQIIKLYDAAFHEALDDAEGSLIRAMTPDARWIKIRRPTVVVGGELTLDSLEIRHDPTANVSEASLQLKSNCGCLLIDDFGRQRVEPAALLNRWIVPLENRFDFLTLATGRKIQVPFDQLIIFSTNLEPDDLADEAFLRRIPYKVEVGNPSLQEFRTLFQHACQAVGCTYRPEAVDYLVQKHYRPTGRQLRRCHARDLLAQIKNYCVYLGTDVELRPDYLDRAVNGYFTATAGSSQPAPQS